MPDHETTAHSTPSVIAIKRISTPTWRGSTLRGGHSTLQCWQGRWMDGCPWANNSQIGSSVFFNSRRDRHRFADRQTSTTQRFRRDEVHRRRGVSGRCLVPEHLKGQLDALDADLAGMLLDRCQNRAVLDGRLDRRDAVEADDENLAGAARRLDGGERPSAMLSLQQSRALIWGCSQSIAEAIRLA